MKQFQVKQSNLKNKLIRFQNFLKKQQNNYLIRQIYKQFYLYLFDQSLCNYNKQKQGPQQYIKQKKNLTEPIQQLSEISEQRTTFHQFYPETSRSTIKLPQLSPNTSRVYSHKTFLSQVIIPDSKKLSPIIQRVKSQDKIKNQFKQFIQIIDSTKASFDKSYQNDKQLLLIQQRRISDMTKIGEIPLESLRILNKKEFQINNLKLSKQKKLAPMQIL